MRARQLPPLPEEKLDNRYFLKKRWAAYKRKQMIELAKKIEQIEACQLEALKELREESEELYQAAIQPMNVLLPITIKGPTFTPPNTAYTPPAEYRSNENNFYSSCSAKMY